MRHLVRGKILPTLRRRAQYILGVEHEVSIPKPNVAASYMTNNDIDSPLPSPLIKLASLVHISEQEAKEGKERKQGENRKNKIREGEETRKERKPRRRSEDHIDYLGRGDAAAPAYLP